MYNAGALSLFRQLARAIGTDLPAEVNAAIDAANSLRRIRLDDLFGDTPDLATAVAAAVREGVDVVTHPGVQRALAVGELSRANIGTQLISVAEGEIVAALTEHAAAIVETWRPAAEKAGADIAAFRAIAPGVDLAADDVVSKLPPRALTPWGKARDAVMLLDQIGKGWDHLATVTGMANVTFGRRPLVLADLTLEQLTELGHHPKAGAVSQLDVAIDLASPDVFRERAARMDKSRADQAAAQAAASGLAQSAAARQFYGTGQSITVP